MRISSYSNEMENNARLKHAPGYKILIISVILAIIGFSLTAASPALAAPAVSISSSSGSPGSAVTITGSDFVVGDSYSIVFAPGTVYEQTLVHSTTIAAGTTFSQTVNIPPAPWASHTIRVNTNRGNFPITFQITPFTDLHIFSGYAGDFVIVTGAGFRANISVRIIFGTTQVASVTSDAFGSLPATSITVPILRSSNYSVYGTDSIATSPPASFSLNTRITASVSEGTTGDQITLTGSGFDYNSPLTLLWDNQSISSIQISSTASGNFTTKLTVPAASRGNHTIRVVDYSSRQAAMLFSIKSSLAVSTTSGNPGAAVTITGKGFRSSATVTIRFNGVAVATQPSTITTDSTGSFSAVFTVPSVIAGSYIIEANDSVNSVLKTFSVSSVVEVTPVSGSVGTNLQIRGRGFTPSSGVVISYDNQGISTVTTDIFGAFVTSFSAPVSHAGAHTISARDVTVMTLVTTATFTMESTPPPKPTLLTPATGSQTTLTPEFTWSQVTDPSGVTYSLQAARDPSFSQIVLNIQGSTVPGYKVSQAEAFSLTKKQASYYWRVKAIDLAGNESDWTTAFSFYTQDSTSPSAPSPVNPANDSQAVTNPLFTWTEVTDVSGVSYSLQVARDSGFSQPVVVKEGLTASSYQVADTEKLGLTKQSNPYYWRVIAVDGEGNQSAWSLARTFYTRDSTPPASATPLKPEYGSQQSSRPSFDWTDATDPSGVSYTLQVALDSAFSRIVLIKEGLTVSEYKLTGDEKLNISVGDPPGTYYWRVAAIDNEGNTGTWSAVNEFTVKDFWQSGWPLYLAFITGGILLLALGVYIGMRMKRLPLITKRSD